jgi:hypothetical protein
MALTKTNLENIVEGVLPVANGGTGTATSTGSGNAVLSTSPTLVTPALGTPSALVLTNATGLGYGAMPAGSVLQVVNAIKTDRFSSSSTTFVDVTGLTATITPKFATSKILVSISIGTLGQSGSVIFGFKVLRNSTAIGLGDATGSTQQVTFSSCWGGGDINATSGTAYVLLDTPATTSATTYKVQICNINNTTSNTMVVNGSSNTANGYTSSGSSTVTLMEIAQ